jgi:uncharacterized protein YdeI (YjbR/CyaY-like superfamily)
VVDVENAIPLDSAQQFDDWLTANGATERGVWIAIYTKTSGKQTVSFDSLLEIGLCHGWVDIKTKKIDDERYGIRFVPRRPGSNWSPRNRLIVKRLLGEHRLTPAGIATLPPDL